MEILIFFLIFLSGGFLLVSTNPLYSVIALIAIFLNFSVLMFANSLDFLALIFIIIYVGAICVLFLFIIMLLNLRVVESTTRNNLVLFLIIISGVILFIGFFIDTIQLEDINSELILFNEEIYNFIFLYYNYFFYFILIAFILLFSMVSAILLTKNKVKRTQVVKNFNTFY